MRVAISCRIAVACLADGHVPRARRKTCVTNWTYYLSGPRDGTPFAGSRFVLAQQGRDRLLTRMEGARGPAQASGRGSG